MNLLIKIKSKLSFCFGLNTQFKSAFLFIFLASYSTVFTGCFSNFSSQALNYASLQAESTPCTTSFSYPSGIPLSGTALFERRMYSLVTDQSDGSLKNIILGDPVASPLPIRNAEIAVYDKDNKLVQCGTTDANGAFKALTLNGSPVQPLIIPNTSGNFLIRVLARSYREYTAPNDFTSVSVKEDIYKNRVYALEKYFYSNGNSVGNISLLARARQTDSMAIEGGAFNILNSIQVALDYVKTSTAGVDTKCLSNKVNVYWKAGFNAYQYMDPQGDPNTLANSSYYRSSTKSIYITGGQLGNLSMSNTDHFDDFAVIHELGHFIEDHCGNWTSSGGSHALTARIDPRLAWSEGWSNYFAAQVLQNKINLIEPTLTSRLATVTNTFGWTYFSNTDGFSDSVQNIGNGDGWIIDFKRSGTNPGSYTFAPYTGQDFDRVNSSSYPGEGHTREGAISRGLYKLSNSNCGTMCAATPISFIDIFKSFNRITGIGIVDHSFVSSHTFLENLRSMTNTSSEWSSTAPSLMTRDQIITNEALQLKSSGVYSISGSLVWPAYGTKLVSGSTCNLKIMPQSDGALNGSSSDQRYSNHFYTIDFSTLPGLDNITVTFSKVAGTNTDHDLILFKPNYRFNDDYGCSNPACSNYVPIRGINEDVVTANRIQISNLSNYSKNLTGLSTFPAYSKYLLDIRAYTAGQTISSTTEYTYTINSNLGVLCPQ